jgi:hypothetical protein
MRERVMDTPECPAGNNLIPVDRRETIEPRTIMGAYVHVDRE